MKSSLFQHDHASKDRRSVAAYLRGNEDGRFARYDRYATVHTLMSKDRDMEDVMLGYAESVERQEKLRAMKVAYPRLAYLAQAALGLTLGVLLYQAMH